MDLPHNLKLTGLFLKTFWFPFTEAPVCDFAKIMIFKKIIRS